jgi:serine/threonine protein phosphatase PrpC
VNVGWTRLDEGKVVWYQRAASMLCVGVWTERSPGHGEDAEPLLVHHLPTGTGVLGVFDGSGGSGAAVAYETPGGLAHTGAWLGARVARFGVESWFRGRMREETRFEAQSLRQELGELFTLMRPAQRSKIMGTARRELPTTMAVARYQLRGDRAELQVLWAGDSRVHLLTPGSGLQALTRDHTEQDDALDQLLQDPPMTNVLCADQDFAIDQQFQLLDLPCVLVCATDGFFGYIDTPALFEWHLLDVLAESVNEKDWAVRLAGRVADYTGDDASLSLVALGYADFPQLRESFSRRTVEVAVRHRGTVDPAIDRRAFELWRARSWSEYRHRYEQRMPPAGTNQR